MTAPRETFVTKLRQAFNRKSLAHLAIDLQDLYCDPLHPFNARKAPRHDARATRAGRAADAVGAFVKEYRQTMPHIWVTHDCASIYGHPPGFANFHLDMLARESLHHSLPVNDNDPLICKKGFSAFFNTNLHRRLQKDGVDTLLLSGAFSDVCIYDTAADAKSHGYDVYVVKNLVVSSGDDPRSHSRDILKLNKKLGVHCVSSGFVSKIITQSAAMKPGP